MAQRRHILNHRELPPPRHQPAGLPHGRAPSPADDYHQPRRRTYAGELEASLDQHRLTEPLTPWFALRVALGHQAGVPRLPLTLRPSSNPGRYPVHFRLPLLEALAFASQLRFETERPAPALVELGLEARQVLPLLLDLTLELPGPARPLFDDLTQALGTGFRVALPFQAHRARDLVEAGDRYRRRIAVGGAAGGAGPGLSDPRVRSAAGGHAVGRTARGAAAQVLEKPGTRRCELLEHEDVAASGARIQAHRAPQGVDDRPGQVAQLLARSQVREARR